MIKLSKINIKYDKVLLKDSDINFYNSAVHLIKGVSGSGKSTLLYRVGLLSDDSNYIYEINNHSITNIKEEEKALIRKYNISFVFQDASLFNQYTVYGNLELYSSFIGKSYSKDEYIKLLKSVSLNVSLSQPIESLSGGEKQRLAIACALCKKTDIIILDEPTNSLDEDNEKIILSLLNKIAHEQHKCIIIASHSYYADLYADYIYLIEDQKINLVKNNTIKEEISLKETTKKSFDPKFYLKYIIYFMKKYLALNVLMILALVLTSIFSILSYSLNDYYQNINKKEILELCEYQLLITNESDDVYVDDLKTVIKNNKFEDIKKGISIEKIYPYIPIKANICGIDVQVFPYFDENNMERNELCKLDSSSDKGIYLSNSVYSSLSLQNYDLSSALIYYQIGEYKNNHLIYQPYEENCKIKGALKKNIYYSYQPNCDKYINVYYQDLFDMYQTVSMSNEYCAYTVFAPNYEEFKKTKSILSKMNVGINDTFMNLEPLNQLMDYSDKVKVISQMVIIIIFSLVISIMYFNYLKKRNREFALLIANGLSYKSLFKLVCFEMILKLILILIINILGIIILDYFLSINVIYIGGIVLIDLFVMFVLILSLSHYYINRIIPEKILRS